MVEDLDELFGDISTPEESEGMSGSQPPRPPKSRKEMRRSRRHNRRNIVVAIITVLVTVALVGGVGAFSYVKLKQWTERREESSSQLDDFQGPGTGSLSFTVQSGEGVAQIAAHLADADIVKSAEVFASAVSANNSTLYPGTYDLKYHMASADVVAILSDQSKATGILQVRSGERVSDVVVEASKLSGIPESDFHSVVDSGGAGILPAEAKGSYEGWLEPGSYDVKSMKSAGDIIKSMVDKRVAHLDSLSVPQGEERMRILTVASIAESEVNSNAYYGKVARVIVNRLAKNMPLGMDTTVAYGLGIKADALTDKMLADASNPYNTRIATGLPPTPISNPGTNAIEAALNPPQGDWLYFVTTNMKTGETKFATTESEFWKLRDEYKNSNSNAN